MAAVLVSLSVGLLAACSGVDRVASVASTGPSSPLVAAPQESSPSATWAPEPSPSKAPAAKRDPSSVADTLWIGASDGIGYEFYFDRDGEVVTHDLEHDAWTYSVGDGVSLVWSQDGDEVTVATDYFGVPASPAIGTIAGDSLVLVDESGSQEPLDLKRVTPGDSDVAGSEWTATLPASDAGAEGATITYFFDANGSFRSRTIESDYPNWDLPDQTRTQTWTASGETVSMTQSYEANGVASTRVGTIHGNQMTFTSEAAGAGASMVLTRVD